MLERLRPWLTAPACQATLVNTYGPTECTDVCAYAIVPSDAEAAPLGGPVANTRLYVLDARQCLLPAGVPGELWIGGAGVGVGYWGAPSATAARFLPDPFGARPGARMYRTGDKVRYRADGVLDYLGRLDYQVKV